MNNKLQALIFDRSRLHKRICMILADLVLIPLALWLSFSLRLGTSSPDLQDGVWLLLAVPLISIPIFARLGLYRAIIRFLSGHVLSTVLQGAIYSAVAMLLLTFFLDLQGIPRSVFIIYFGAVFLMLGSSRYLVRHYYHMSHNKRQRINVVIYGAGSSGVQLARSLENSFEYQLIAFLDDNLSLHASFVHGAKVYSPLELPGLIEKYHVNQVLLAMPRIKPEKRKQVLHFLEPLSVHVRSIPGLEDLLSGKRSIEQIREISIDELLGRTPVAPDPKLLSDCIYHKSVLVTGAGGSIGSELCRQIIELNPFKLVLLEISEFALYQIERELYELCNQKQIEVEMVAAIGSVQQQSRVEELLKKHKIQTLYHTAAYKHVPLVEYNPLEGVQNNILGTYRTACAAERCGVERFVLISTDKAVRPTNVMGASKRMAELAVQALSKHFVATTFCIVRFGNVLGSSGSVVPLFRKQILKGGPITVTHPDIIRYFMTIPEAAQLVIQAGALARGGEVFLLDMGKPVKIIELARRMIRISGLEERSKSNPTGDIPIDFSGLRPGEKLYEELLIDGASENTAHPRIYKAHEDHISLDEYKPIINKLGKCCDQYDIQGVHQILKAYVSGYQHSAIKNSKVVALPIQAKKIA